MPMSTTRSPLRGAGGATAGGGAPGVGHGSTNNNTEQSSSSLVEEGIWTPEMEITLWQAISVARPIGVHKHFRMISILRQLHKNSHTSVRAADVWKHLSLYFDLPSLDELADSVDEDQIEELSKRRSIYPFYSQTEFSLPLDDFDNLISQTRQAQAQSPSDTPHHPAFVEQDEPKPILPPTRGRGRPPKTEIRSPIETEEGDEENNSEVEEPEDSPERRGARKGRGGGYGRHDEQMEDAEEDDDEVSLSAKPVTATPQKGRKGLRKRARPAEEEDATTKEEDDESKRDDDSEVEQSIPEVKEPKSTTRSSRVDRDRDRDRDHSRLEVETNLGAPAAKRGRSGSLAAGLDGPSTGLLSAAVISSHPSTPDETPASAVSSVNNDDVAGTPVPKPKGRGRPRLARGPDGTPISSKAKKKDSGKEKDKEKDKEKEKEKEREREEKEREKEEKREARERERALKETKEVTEREEEDDEAPTPEAPTRRTRSGKKK
ncbi:hypothetical protein HDU76_011261 [Blyttiomyces sp. JEL0837]|nr:hypothetical protein HDU76_011261 [Blyttiomyces sp. JEL0837]